jgi:tryptophan-rich sensory protein
MPAADPTSSAAAGRQWPALAGFVALCLGVSALGGWATARSVSTWYPTLAKPWFTPPDWLFAPVWLTLYVLMAVAAWRVWRRPEAAGRNAAISLFLLQLGLNLAWSFLFFYWRRIDLGLIDIVLLLAAIIATIVAFRRIDGIAATLLLPYLAWVSFAAVLNSSLWLLN